MRIRIFSRTLFIKNTILFVFLSYFYIFFVENFNDPELFSSSNLLKDYIVTNVTLGVITLLLVLTLYLARNISKFLFLIYILAVLGHSIRVYFIKSTPATLPLSLVYLMCGYYFFSLLSEELKAATFVPNFNKEDLNPVFNRKLKGTIEHEGTKAQFHLLNWDEGGIFAYLPSFKKFRGKVKIILPLENVDFSFEGRIVTAYNKGYGVKITSFAQNDNGWPELFRILDDRGYHLLAKEL